MKISELTNVMRVLGVWRSSIEVSVLLVGGWLAAGFLAGWAQTTA